jgi:ribulose-bisphosphate carboxylase small chain
MAAALLAKSASKAVVACRTEARQVSAKPRLVPAKKAVNHTQLVANTPAADKFYVWNPTNNKMFETFSYLPPLTNDQIALQVEYIIDNGWVPALEFTDGADAYVTNDSVVRFGDVSSNYQDNRYWTMWKLPLFGCTDPDVVLKEVGLAIKAFPNAYVRLVAFDNIRQVQVISFLVHRPESIKDWSPPEKRSVNPEAGKAAGGGGGRRRSRTSSYSW